ncbi:hypothetical protein L0P50_11970 [Lawsonibacter sp. DFI.6.74]|nr:hypothetical protein [Lawsonibacter sp. DFI.6.74]MCG4774056.1 hypothetical protein [Lawsonibacter sp. DFI.5.51]
MTQIGELVNTVYACMEQRDHRSALRTLYKILHMTAQKRHQARIADREMAKAILTERMWIILPMGGQLMLAPGIKLKARMRGLEPDAEGYTALDGILYQALEDAAQGRENDLEWVRGRSIYARNDGGIGLNEGLIWGILLALITCPENKEEHTAEQNGLPVGTVRVAVNDLWGQEEYVKLSYLLDYGVRL